MELTFMQGLVVSLSIGAVIGLVRQWADQHASGHSDDGAGLRTFSLWSVMGFLSAYVTAMHAPLFYPVAVALHGGLLVAANFTGVGKHAPLGLTSLASAILTFFCGSLVMWGEVQAAIALTATVGIIIAIKTPSHEWTKRLTGEDIRTTLQFLAVTGIILPLVPNQGYGPLAAFNPYRIWMMVVLISGLGFCGYILMRLLGARSGILLTGLVGGLASSTATTLALTRNSRETPQLSGTLAIGILIANTVMLLRVIAIVAALDPSLALSSGIALGIMGVPTVFIVLFEVWREKHSKREVEIPNVRNPLRLVTAIKFGLLFGVVTFLIEAVSHWGDGRGFFVVSFISGLTDMDAIALSLVNVHESGRILTRVAAQGILVAAIANTVFKMGFALAIGSPPMRRSILAGMGAMILAGIAAFFLIPQTLVAG